MKLITSPNPILKQIAEPWDFEKDSDAKAVEQDMLALMKTFNGRGLAGNQAGLLKRVFVMKLDNGQEFALFNPEIVSIDDTKVEGEEGCLSFPNLWLKVKRSKTLTAKYLDTDGKECIIELTGMDARCFQHELDHLNGICFTDGLSPLKLALEIKKQRKRKW